MKEEGVGPMNCPATSAIAGGWWELFASLREMSKLSTDVGIDTGSRLDDDLVYWITIRHSCDLCLPLGGCVITNTRATLPVVGEDLSAWSSCRAFGV